MTPASLRATLETALAPHLGTYTRTGYPSRPAIHVGAKTPPGWEVQGLECVILPTPELEREPEFSEGTSLRAKRTFTVYLKQWNPASDTTAATIAVLRTFPDVKQPSLVPATDLTIEQAKFKITEGGYI